ncbi:ubiquitin carboxyl-terminal hydrolase 3-like [Salarias fasciatus]|uniref:ubiquitin carboxyl-terminal hydrolase 3-like n=1 Tax=Salarias fasciatus TaxID=181472 RepID=UPI0011765A4F|nr:ubiquitin carboxyl-terminal hydrolase 3-like [Salarias fasciatus]
MSKGESKGRGRDSSFTKDNQFYGLRNQGSTSYLNSVLQVLFMTEEFREAVKRHTEDNSNTTHIDRQLSELFDELKEGPAETIGITHKLGIRSVNKQSDAAEHFEKILALTSPEASKIFRGNLVHTTECLKCVNKTYEEGKFWHLPLPLEDSCSQSYSVEKGVAEFFVISELKGENQLYCDGCGEKRDATVEREMKHHPDILTLLLKRFEFDYRYMSYTKNSCAVDVPPTLEVPQGQIYDLYAFVEHVGSLKSGHYSATVKPQDGRGARWYNFNDSRVAPLDQNLKVDNMKTFLSGSSSPYLLFYRKRKDANIRGPSTNSSARERIDQSQRKTKRESKAGNVAPGNNKWKNKHDSGKVNSQPKSNSTIKTSVITHRSSTIRDESQNQNEDPNTAAVSKNEKKPKWWNRMRHRDTGKNTIKKDKNEGKQMKLEITPQTQGNEQKKSCLSSMVKLLQGLQRIFSRKKLLVMILIVLCVFFIHGGNWLNDEVRPGLRQAAREEGKSPADVEGEETSRTAADVEVHGRRSSED